MDHKFPVDAGFVRENAFVIASLFMDTIKKKVGQLVHWIVKRVYVVSRKVN
jgi:hypothetical protein